MALSERQHSHGSHGSMSSMGGMPSYATMQKRLWIIIGSVIAFATLINALNYILLRQRLRTSSARPRTALAVCFATATAIIREISQASLPAFRFKWLHLRTPQVGKTAIALSWFAVVLSICFWRYDLSDQWSWEDIAFQAGSIAQAELPLVFLLAGKQNIIGYLIGSSYERLNWLHRWVARMLWITVTIHMSFWFRSWARYDYILRKLQIDRLTQTGFASWIILTVIVLTSFYPLRKLSYEVFLMLHIILFSGLVGAIYLHLETSYAYLWACVGIFLLDRSWRILVSVWANFSFLHRKSGIWANRATLTPLPGNVTRISISEPVISWAPGQHMFVSCHSLLPLQTHPFTAASLPSDRKLEFLVQSQTGGTRRFFRWASRQQDLSSSNGSQQKLIGIEGPYGAHRPLQQFDSVTLFAGSTGATFTVPLMRDLVCRWRDSLPVVTRRIKFVWIIKSRSHMTWFEEQLEQALTDVAELRTRYNKDVHLDISIYITCDDKLEPISSGASSASSCEPREHGEAEAIAKSTSSASSEKQSSSINKNTDGKIDVEIVPSSSSSTSEEKKCRCKTTIDEKTGIRSDCCCTRGQVSAQARKETNSALRILSGRPKVKAITRAVLEQAHGESAVVVCGPRGLQDDVRRSVNYLCDERAVHKGTGAQGVYLHVEGFSY